MFLWFEIYNLHKILRYFLDIKRIIGRQFDDAVVQRFAQSVETQFTVRKLLGGPILEFEHRGQVMCSFLSLILVIFLGSYKVAPGYFSSSIGQNS